ncbi:hypothetical protein RRG08_051365 [Elysia crispata]|uniref:Uncharacterized protein n=1 Tax=Elysia crispata TaxID=231223 RepID=A0AAE1B3R7_9GAST|nr:hypothetical protein RRG08_051365 [Elysia crispata]
MICKKRLSLKLMAELAPPVDYLSPLDLSSFTQWFTGENKLKLRMLSLRIMPNLRIIWDHVILCVNKTSGQKKPTIVISQAIFAVMRQFSFLPCRHSRLRHSYYRFTSQPESVLKSGRDKGKTTVADQAR